jgi:branched-subunit amino acid transport protein AzlD
MTAKDAETLRSRSILWTQAGLHASWALGALAGGVVGATLLSGVKGFGFVLTALFVVLAMDAYRSRPDMRTMLLAVGCAVVAVLVAPKTMMLAAMSLFGLTLIARHAINRRPVMHGDLYLAATLAAAVAITVALRAIPFAVKNALRDSALIADVGRWMPLGAITILVVYALGSIDVVNWANGMPEFAGVVVTVVLHKWRHNAVLSILGGTLVCIALANTLPPV